MNFDANPLLLKLTGLGGNSVILSLTLMEGQNVSEEALRSLSLRNAKQLVVGNAYGFGVVLHIVADTPADLSNALLEFEQVPGVTGVTLLATRSSI